MFFAKGRPCQQSACCNEYNKVVRSDSSGFSFEATFENNLAA